MAQETEKRAEGRWMRSLRPAGGWPLALGMAVPLVSGALLVWQALTLARVLGRAVGEGAPLTALTPDIALLCALLLARVLLGLLGEAAAGAGSERIKLALRRALFRRLLSERPDWSANRASGALAGALVEQVEALDGFFARFLPATLAAAVLPIAFAAVVMPADWVVGLLFLLTAPLIPLFMALAGWGAEAASAAQAEALARLSGRFADRLRGLVTLALLGRGEAEAEAAERSTDELRRRTLRVLRLAFLSSAVLEFFAALGVAGVALYVGLTYLDLVSLRASPLTLEAGLFCLLMAPEVYQPLRTLAAHYHDRAGAKAAVREIAAVFEHLPNLGEAQELPTQARLLPGGALGIEASALFIRAPGGDRTILAGADLTLAPGAHVALMGPSGIGKSTLLEALAGLRETEGTLRLGPVPIKAVSREELCHRVAFLPQRPNLFTGTIRDNIRFADPEASDAQVRRAAERARVLAFAGALPLGLETPIGEDGLGLSGGERHRVALARLYLRDPSIVLLDEPTAHLDAVTEAEVLQELLRFTEGRTLLVATHSAKVAAALGRALRLEGGRLLPVPHPLAPLEDAA
ncbi:thiol reductant ABC exporter subunit CydD [Aureimonas sp. AU40]|uniref:thiol reductant ABC exporter subunit CydD n=1 Tax=Aureimonas sp. AU40 TaxID=1637747 RepID=UPI000781D641|nr:thiol reductant ABC exporter subunit CydD [Aureimonas sp. AU40]